MKPKASNLDSASLESALDALALEDEHSFATLINVTDQPLMAENPFWQKILHLPAGQIIRCSTSDDEKFGELAYLLQIVRSLTFEEIAKAAQNDWAEYQAIWRLNNYPLVRRNQRKALFTYMHKKGSLSAYQIGNTRLHDWQLLIRLEASFKFNQWKDFSTEDILWSIARTNPQFPSEWRPESAEWAHCLESIRLAVRDGLAGKLKMIEAVQSAPAEILTMNWVYDRLFDLSDKELAQYLAGRGFAGITATAVKQARYSVGLKAVKAL